MLEDIFSLLHFNKKCALAQFQFVGGPNSGKNAVNKLALILISGHIAANLRQNCQSAHSPQNC